MILKTGRQEINRQPLRQKRSLLKRHPPERALTWAPQILSRKWTEPQVQKIRSRPTRETWRQISRIAGDPSLPENWNFCKQVLDWAFVIIEIILDQFYDTMIFI